MGPFLSSEALQDYAATLAASWKGGQVVALLGDLGVGKTTFVKGVAKALDIVDPVVSPTYVYLQTYEGSRLDLYHFDLYRLRSFQDLSLIGFEEYLDRGGICIIEWPHLATSILPSTTLVFALTMRADASRFLDQLDLDEVAISQRSI